MSLFRVWSRKNEPESLWCAMPYAPRTHTECEHLIDNYHERFGNLYEYETVPIGQRPMFGMCVPYSY